MTQEVIALLMPERDAGETVAGLRALIRKDDGNVVLQDVSEESALVGDGVDRFQRAVPLRIHMRSAKSRASRTFAT